MLLKEHLCGLHWTTRGQEVECIGPAVSWRLGFMACGIPRAQGFMFILAVVKSMGFGIR